MNIKLFSIVLLILFFCFALIQIQSFAGFNPIFHSMATSVRYWVKWVLQLPAEPENQIVLKSPHQFLNSTDETKVAPLTTSQPKYKQKLDQTHEPSLSDKDTNFESLFNAFESEPTHSATSHEDEETFKVLSNIIGLEDPVTDLFPETEWYETEFDFNDIHYSELGEDWETNNIPDHEDLERNQVKQLLEELRSEIPNHSRISQLDTLDHN